jgi:RsiW-degrading membrane proteinase PrsW (M82 family)
MHLLFLAIAPVMVIVLYIYFKDKFEKEPIHFLFKNFLLGAFVSVLITFVLSIIAGFVFNLSNDNSILNQFIKAFIIVALVEEFSKYVIIRYYAQTNKEFNEPFDGIVYSVMVSMGFAALENVLYVIQHGVETGITRAFTAIPAHAAFAILLGYFMGKAKFSKNRIQLNLMGLLVATIFHGAYDFFLFINFLPGTIVGALTSLFVGVFLSRKAIKIHQKNSNFNV